MIGWQIQQGELTEQFDNINDWSVTGGTAVEDTTVYKTGNKSIKLTSGNGTYVFITKTINKQFGAGNLEIRIFVPDGELGNILNIAFYISSQNNFASYFQYTLDNYYLHEGWNTIIISKDEFTGYGGEDWSNTMVKLRVRLNAETNQSPIVYIDSIYSGKYSRPKCILYWDDSWLSAYTEGYSFIKNLGFRGVMANIHRYIGNSNRISLAQAQEMYQNGWDFVVHDDGNWSTDYTNQADVQAAIDAGKQWLIDNGFTRKKMYLHAAYPQGGYDTDVLNAMTALKMRTGRTIINRTQAHELDHNLLLTRQVLVNTTTLDTAKSYVERTIKHGGCVMFNFHKLVATPAVSTEYSISDFQALMTYLKQKEAVIDVVTLTEWYDGVTGNMRKQIV